jgi:hypothetical protein
LAQAGAFSAAEDKDIVQVDIACIRKQHDGRQDGNALRVSGQA